MSKFKFTNQLELPIERDKQPDRNSAIGGRSFYFFDFDDNVVYLPTLLYIFHNETGEEKALTTREFARISEHLGKSGEWAKFELRFNDETGSFRRFREKKLNFIDRFMGRKQPLVEDIVRTIKLNHLDWRGPSWNFFWHAVHNNRPLSIITARGHSADTFKAGISVLVKSAHLTQEPNYLSVFAVSNKHIRENLGDESLTMHTAELKKKAIHRSVNEAFRQYGENPGHRFGMSDDDPVNIRLIIEAMRELKVQYPKNSFFVIDTQHGGLSKQEILIDIIKNTENLNMEQLRLFDT
jgi:hypothetical protein